MTLEVFLFDAGVVAFDTQDCLCPLLWGKKACRQRIIREEEPDSDAIYYCHTSSEIYGLLASISFHRCNNVPMNHFQLEKEPVCMNSVAYDNKPEVIGLAFPTAHMQGINIACSS